MLAQALPCLWHKVPRPVRSHTAQQPQHWSCTQLPPRLAPKFPAGCIFSLSILSESWYQWAWPGSLQLLELMGNGHALLSLLSVKLTKDHCPAVEGEPHGLIDWRTTGRANLLIADKAECWISQRAIQKLSGGSPGTGLSGTCSEKQTEKLHKGFTGSEGTACPSLKFLSIGSFLGITADPGNWSVSEISFSSLSLHLGLPADSCWEGTHNPHVFSSPFKNQQAPGCQGTNDKMTTCRK